MSLMRGAFFSQLNVTFDVLQNSLYSESLKLAGVRNILEVETRYE